MYSTLLVEFLVEHDYYQAQSTENNAVNTILVTLVVYSNPIPKHTYLCIYLYHTCARLQITH